MIKPLELVVSAIHCLSQKHGSSRQDIIRFLQGKYGTNSEILKTHVQAGLRRGLRFGLLVYDSGLYRLNDILNAPLDDSEIDSKETETKQTRPFHKKMKKKRLARRYLRHGRGKGKKITLKTMLHRGGKKVKKIKNFKKTIIKGEGLSRRRALAKLARKKQRLIRSKKMVKADGPQITAPVEGANKTENKGEILADSPKQLESVVI